MFYHTVFLLTDHITGFYQLMGVPNPQWQEDFVDQILDALSEVHSLKAAALLCCGSGDSLVIAWFGPE